MRDEEPVRDAAARDDNDLIDRAARFTDALAEGRFTDAETLADRSFAAEQIAGAWDSVLRRNGPFQSVGESRTERVGGLDVAIVTLTFDRGAVDLRIVFDVAGRISGFLFARARAQGDPYTVPIYADTESFFEEDLILNVGGLELPGMLTLPLGGGPSPAVVLVADSGPFDRDETLGPNKPLRDIAWGLATRGIGSLRFDKRTFLYGSQLDMEKLTYAEEFVEDALEAVRLLADDDRIDPRKIFVLGHGLGGQLAPEIARRSRPSLLARLFGRDHPLAGLILMGAPARPLAETMADHLEQIAMEDGKMTEEERQSIDRFEARIDRILASGDPAHPPVMGLTYTYLEAMNEYDAISTAQKAGVPMFVAHGRRDFQISTRKDFEAWRRALSGREGVAFKLYSNLNHLFMPGQGRSYPSEYERPNNVAKVFIDDLVDWIGRTGNER